MGKRRLKSPETFLCNDCGKVVKMRIHEEVIDHDVDGKEIREKYLQCSKCKRRYTIIILDGYMRIKIAEEKATNEFSRKQLLMREAREHLRELKQRYGRD